MKYETFSPNHGKYLLRAIETANELGHLSPSEYRELKAEVLETIKQKARKKKKRKRQNEENNNYINSNLIVNNRSSRKYNGVSKKPKGVGHHNIHGFSTAKWVNNSRRM